MGYKNNIFKEGLLTGIGKVPTTDILEIGGNIQLDGLIKSDGVAPLIHCESSFSFNDFEFLFSVLIPEYKKNLV